MTANVYTVFILKLGCVIFVKHCEYTKKYWIVYFKWVKCVLCESGKTGVLQSMGSQSRTGLSNWTELIFVKHREYTKKDWIVYFKWVKGVLCEL